MIFYKKIHSISNNEIYYGLFACNMVTIHTYAMDMVFLIHEKV